MSSAKKTVFVFTNLLLLFFTNSYVNALSAKNLPIAEYEVDPKPYGDSAVCIIPFKRAGNLILIEANAGGEKGNFILDTGAPRLVLNLTYFRKAEPRLLTSAGGISGGITNVLHLVVDQFKMGNYSYKNIDADVVNLGHLEDLKDEKILGLIGLNLLKNFTVFIDYNHNLIKLKLLKKKDVFNFHDQLKVNNDSLKKMPIKLTYNKLILLGIIAGKKLNFIIDTGAESNILDSRLPNKVLDNVDITGRILLGGTGKKKVEALNGLANGLTLGGISIQEIPVIVTNLKDMCLAFDFCIDGMLGFDFLSLQKVEINFVTKEMYLWK
jgi:predicted aspartyl protease